MNPTILLHALENLYNAAVRAGASGDAVDNAADIIADARRTRQVAAQTGPQAAGATWAKLKDGSWGIRTPGKDNYAEGQLVTVKTKAGKAQRRRLGVSVASGEGWALWTAQEEAREDDALRNYDEGEEAPF